MRLPGVGARGPAVPVEPGERLLASCAAEGAVLGGTRDALYLVADETTRIPWEQVEAADWDQETRRFRVSEVGRWGEPRHEHSFAIDEPLRLLELVRERVTASIVLQRHIPVSERRGFRVIGRRSPSRAREIAWLYEYDDGIDPTAPDVRAAAAAALAQARADVGDA